MKVLLLNGSPHKEGCTHTALAEVAAALEGEGVDYHRGLVQVSFACKDEA